MDPDLIVEQFAFLQTDFGFVLTSESDEQVTFTAPQLLVEVVQYRNRPVVRLRHSNCEGRPLGTVLLNEVVEIRGDRASQAVERLAMTDDEESAHSAELLRKYCEPMLRGDFSEWDVLVETVSRQFIDDYHRSVRDALRPVLAEFALLEEEGPRAEVMLFRGEQSTLMVILDGAGLEFSIAADQPEWTQGEWFRLSDIVEFKRQRLEPRQGSYNRVFRYDAIGYVRKQLDAAIPLLREYGQELLHGDFSEVSELREFCRDPELYARSHDWFIDPALFPLATLQEGHVSP